MRESKRRDHLVGDVIGLSFVCLVCKNLVSPPTLSNPIPTQSTKQTIIISKTSPKDSPPHKHTVPYLDVHILDTETQTIQSTVGAGVMDFRRARFWPHPPDNPTMSSGARQPREAEHGSRKDRWQRTLLPTHGNLLSIGTDGNVPCSQRVEIRPSIRTDGNVHRSQRLET